jgi:hypothetical protein
MSSLSFGDRVRGLPAELGAAILSFAWIRDSRLDPFPVNEFTIQNPFLVSRL